MNGVKITTDIKGVTNDDVVMSPEVRMRITAGDFTDRIQIEFYDKDVFVKGWFSLSEIRSALKACSSKWYS